MRANAVRIIRTFGLTVVLMALLSDVLVSPAADVALPAASTPRLTRQVIGYFPDWEFGRFSKIDLSALTQINYFSIIPGADGSLPKTSATGAGLWQLQEVVAAAHSATPPVPVSIVIDPYAPFLQIAESQTATANFVSNLMDFCVQYDLDGVDLDFEPSTITTDQMTSYGNLIAAIHAGTSVRGLVLSAAVQASKLIIPAANIADIDLYLMMDYELRYDSSAPYDASITYLTNWTNYGIPKSKLFMGVPFFGRSGTSWSATTAKTYASILNNYFAEYGSYPDTSLDTVTISGVTWGFNGRDTIEAKARYVVQNGYAGMMIWELGQDHFASQGNYDEYSLLPAIKNIFSLIGDINTDGYVNVGDLQTLAAAWASQDTPPSANWNPAADINADGYVNVGDLQLLIASWAAQL